MCTATSTAPRSSPRRLADVATAVSDVAGDLVRDILEAVCERDGISLASAVEPGEPARNYELALRLRIGRVFRLTDGAHSAGDGEHGPADA